MISMTMVLLSASKALFMFMLFDVFYTYWRVFMGLWDLWKNDECSPLRVVFFSTGSSDIKIIKIKKILRLAAIRVFCAGVLAVLLFVGAACVSS